MLFADYLLGWLEIVKGQVKPTTFALMESMVKQTIEPYFRNKPITLKDLEARHIHSFIPAADGQANSVIHYHAVIHQALKYAMKTDLVAQNVAMKVDRPKKNDFQPVFLDAAELQRLFEVVKGTKLELPVLVAAFYGLRRGECWDSSGTPSTLSGGTLTIKRTVTSVNVGWKTQNHRAGFRQDQIQYADTSAGGKIQGIFCRGQGGAGPEQAGLRQLLQLRIRRLCICR